MDSNNLEDGYGNGERLLPTPTAFLRSRYDELWNFRMSLKWCALDHSSLAGKSVSFSAFVILTIIAPVVASLSIEAAPSVSFNNRLVQFPESILAIISFVTLSKFFSHYGLRQLLLLDGLDDDDHCVRRDYGLQLDRAFRYLACILLPSFSVEVAHKIIFFSNVSLHVPHMLAPCNSIALLVVTLASWVYRTGVFLLVCVLFRLTCELQILRFEGFYKMFDASDETAMSIFREHLRIKRQLLVTSHRYRIFLIVCLVTITVCQLGGLVLVLTSKFKKNFLNSGDLVVCSVVQVSGFLMCLFGAARITHRAQRVVSIASRWNMIRSSCYSNNRPTNTPPILDQLEGSECTSPEPKLCDTSASPPSATETSTLESRQALVMYLNHNSGGITLYGFALDRGLLHTLFAFELTLVLWILGKVIVVT